jgi:hypothetical protein
MKLRKLEELLDDVEAFPKPKVKLEQYPTSPHIAYLFYPPPMLQDLGGALNLLTPHITSPA